MEINGGALGVDGFAAVLYYNAAELNRDCMAYTWFNILILCL